MTENSRRLYKKKVKTENGRELLDFVVYLKETVSEKKRYKIETTSTEK